MASFIHGIDLTPTPLMQILMNTLNSRLNELVDVDTYKAQLAQFSLTCDNCYAYLRPGIFPIDSQTEFLKRICTDKFIRDDDQFFLHIQGMNASDFEPLNFGSLNIFVLCNTFKINELPQHFSAKTNCFRES